MLYFRYITIELSLFGNDRVHCKLSLSALSGAVEYMICNIERPNLEIRTYGTQIGLDYTDICCHVSVTT